MNLTDFILGFAIGDAFGAGVEFQDRDWIRQNVDFTKFINVRFSLAEKTGDPSFIQNYKAWNYSDDTEMTLAVMKAIMSGKPFTQELLIIHFTKEYKSGIEKNGYGRNGHGSMGWVFEGKKSIEEVRRFQSEREYPGNAPVMRGVPIGFLPDDKINEFATINATATHPNKKAIAASILIARATEYLLIKKYENNGLIPYCISHIKGIDEETIILLEKADKLKSPLELSETDYEILCGPQPIIPPRFFPGIKGLPSDAMLTAVSTLYILKHSTNAFEALKNAVNLGGDVDTIASICCGIMSCRYGIQSLPEFMLENLEGKNYLKEIANHLESYINKNGR